MAENIHEVFEAALSLPAEARSELADLLRDSLEQEIRQDPEAVRRAWSEEIARRQREFAAGNVELIPWDVVRARVSRTG